MATQPAGSASARASASSRASGGSSTDTSASSFTTDDDLCDDVELEPLRDVQLKLVQIVEGSAAATGGSKENSPSSRKQIARDIKIHCYKYFDGDGVEPTKSFLGKLHAHDKVFEMVDIDMAYEMLKYLFAYDEGRAGRKLLARTVAGLDSVTIGNTVDHMSDADASSS